jgi:hypothetical protein
MKVCTKPMSCEFDIKSVTYLQMAQSRAEHLSTPKKEVDLKSVTNSQMAKSRAEHLSPPKKGCRLTAHIFGNLGHSTGLAKLWGGWPIKLVVQSLNYLESLQQ